MPRCVCPNFGSFERRKLCNRAAASSHLITRSSHVSCLRYQSPPHQHLLPACEGHQLLTKCILEGFITCSWNSKNRLSINCDNSWKRPHLPRCWAESVTCRSNWIRCSKTRATSDPEMLCWWIHKHMNWCLGKVNSEFILPGTSLCKHSYILVFKSSMATKTGWINPASPICGCSKFNYNKI